MRMNQIFKIEGMTCNGCTNAVKNKLETLPGSPIVTVILEKGEAHIQGTEIYTQEQIKKVLEPTPYKVV